MSFTQQDLDRAVTAERVRCQGIMALPSNPAKGTALMRQCIAQGLTVQEADAWMRDAAARGSPLLPNFATSNADAVESGDETAAGWDAAFAKHVASSGDRGIDASWDRAFGITKTEA